jgi:BAAT / Acyl-CoA thioester hydrolase C terminal
MPSLAAALRLLMFSAKDDEVWPSDIFAAPVVERLKAHPFKHPVEHFLYEGAGHQITRPFVPTSDVRQVRLHPVRSAPSYSAALRKARPEPTKTHGRN